MNRTAVYVLAVAFLTTPACGLHRPNLPWRTVDSGTRRSANPDLAHPDPKKCPPGEAVPGELDGLANKSTQRRTRCTSHEVYNTTESHPEFDLHIAEFDDQGLFWNRAQVDESLRQIKEVSEKQDVLVLVFFHGWFNNADVCNGKLSCFRELVALVAEAERRYMYPQRQEAERGRPASGRASLPRRVIGVFGGWRGETLAVEGLKFLTFWGRKSTAHTVGENGAATELISRLTSIVRRQPEGSINDQSATAAGKTSGAAANRVAADTSSLIVIGHSFGGALLMSAVGNELNRAAGEALALGDSLTTVTSRLADLIVLINPAVEASRFDNVRRAAADATFSPKQLPILLTLSSEADTPNQILFPLGQSLAVSQKAARSREQWQGMIQSLGTFKTNQTHRLIAHGDAPPARTRKVACQCDAGIRDYGEFLLESLKPMHEELRRLHEALRLGQREDVSSSGLPHAARQDFKYSRLEPMQDVDRNSPFMMVQVDDDIIGGHSDIFNPRIVDFVIRFLIVSDVKRLLVQSDLVSTDSTPKSPGPFTQQPGKPACFDVSRSPDGLVSTVRVDRRALPTGDTTRRVIVERLEPTRSTGAFAGERRIAADEDEFQYTFTRAPATYRLTAFDEINSPLSECNPIEMDVAPPRERSRLFGAYGVVGMADGIGAQVGGAVLVKRVGIQSSVIFPAARDRDVTSDLELGWRGNRSITGVGYRRRQGTQVDQAEKIGYVHWTLELPGVRLLGNIWSSWLGVEFRPIAKMTGSDAWTGQFDLGLRLQLRWPRERWFD